MIKPLATVRWPGQWWEDPAIRARYFRVSPAPPVSWATYASLLQQPQQLLPVGARWKWLAGKQIKAMSQVLLPVLPCCPTPWLPCCSPPMATSCRHTNAARWQSCSRTSATGERGYCWLQLAAAANWAQVHSRMPSCAAGGSCQLCYCWQRGAAGGCSVFATGAACSSVPTASCSKWLCCVTALAAHRCLLPAGVSQSLWGSSS